MPLSVSQIHHDANVLAALEGQSDGRVFEQMEARDSVANCRARRSSGFWVDISQLAQRATWAIKLIAISRRKQDIAFAIDRTQQIRELKP